MPISRYAKNCMNETLTLLLFLLLSVATLSPVASAEPELARFEFTQTEMAVPIRIVLYAADSTTAGAAAQAAFGRFHELNAILSDYDPESELRRLCDASKEGSPVRVGDDLWRVLERALDLSGRSDGAFDVTVGPVVRLWRSARQTKELPSPESIQAALARVGYRFVRLDPGKHTVELLRPKMRLDLGGIAKGYAVDEALAVLRKRGIVHTMVEAGGNIGFGDAPPGKPGWRVGIAPPEPGPPREHLWLAGGHIDFRRHVAVSSIIQGKRYSHLINPKTGMPLVDHCQVTLVGPDGLSTDGVSTAVAILGPEKGLKLVDSLPDAAALIVRTVDGKQETYESKRWKELPRAD